MMARRSRTTRCSTKLGRLLGGANELAQVGQGVALPAVEAEPTDEELAPEWIEVVDRGQHLGHESGPLLGRLGLLELGRDVVGTQHDVLQAPGGVIAHRRGQAVGRATAGADAARGGMSAATAQAHGRADVVLGVGGEGRLVGIPAPDGLEQADDPVVDQVLSLGRRRVDPGPRRASVLTNRTLARTSLPSASRSPASIASRRVRFSSSWAACSSGGDSSRESSIPELVREPGCRQLSPHGQLRNRGAQAAFSSGSGRGRFRRRTWLTACLDGGRIDVREALDDLLELADLGHQLSHLLAQVADLATEVADRLVRGANDAAQQLVVGSQVAHLQPNRGEQLFG